MKEEFTMHVPDGGPVDAFCGYFDVLFKGSTENPADVEIRLPTGPDPTGEEIIRIQVADGALDEASREGGGPQ